MRQADEFYSSEKRTNGLAVKEWTRQLESVQTTMVSEKTVQDCVTVEAAVLPYMPNESEG